VHLVGCTIRRNFKMLSFTSETVRCSGVYFRIEPVLFIYCTINFYVLFTVHLSISLDNDQLDAHLLYFTMRLLCSSTCFKLYMLIIRRLNCIDAATGIVLSVSDRPVHSLRENSSSISTCAPDGH